MPKQVKVGASVLDIDDLVREVKKCDKHFGVNVRNSDIYAEPEKVFDRALSEAQDYLVSLICALNGFNAEDYMVMDEDTGLIVSGPIGTIHFDFVKTSFLDWNTKRVFSYNSLEFKLRFLTLFITDIMCNITEITVHRFQKKGKIVGIYEHAYFYLKEIIDDVKKLTLCMLYGDSYKNILLKMFFNSTYFKKKIDSKEVNSQVFKGVTGLRDGFEISILDDTRMEDDIAIHQILRLAYITATNDQDVSILPQFKFIEGATVYHDLRKLLEELGCKILQEAKYKKRSMMYRAWSDSNPEIWTDYEDINDNWYLSIGVRSVCFVDFLCSTKSIHRFITEMIHKGY